MPGLLTIEAYFAIIQAMMKHKKALIALFLLLFCVSAFAAQPRYFITGVPHIKQRPQFSAAASCVMVLNCYRQRFSQEKIKESQIINIEKETGLDLDKTFAYLKQQNLKVELRYADMGIMERFVQAEIPIIVSTWTDLNKKNLRFRVVIGFDNEKGTVTFIDPTDAKEYEMKQDAFLQLWNISGARRMIVIYP